jgi:hypothetical protein
MTSKHAILVAALVVFLVVEPLPTPDGGTPNAALFQSTVAWAEEDGFWYSEEIDRPVSMVALAWGDTAPEATWFRTKDGNEWGPWTRLPISDDHAPDPDTDEWENSIPATEAVWVGDQDGVQYRVRGGSPEEIEAVAIDTIEASKPSSLQLPDLFSPDVAEGAPPKPTIRPRSQWDPSNACAPRVPADYGQVTHAFVHHTTGTNSYTQAQVPARILGICLFHRDTRGWNDMAYNFLIDRFGNIWEGRAGGVDRGVQGGHTAGFNTYSMGVAFIGDHTSASPTPVARDALVRLLAWKFGVHNVDPTAITVVVSKGSAKYDEGTPVAMRAISAHIDAQATSCPGEACLARMGSFRTNVANRWQEEPLDNYQSPIVADFSGTGQLLAAIYHPSSGRWRVTRPGGSTSFWTTFSASARSGWNDHVAGDFNGDGRDDIAHYRGTSGNWTVSRSTGSGFVNSTWTIFSARTGWNEHLVGDFNGDGRDDIAHYRGTSGNWTVSRSTGSGFINSTWNTFSTRTGWTKHLVGDFNRDGRDDIAHFRQATGTWSVSRSTGTGFVTGTWGRFTVTSGWSHHVVGDFNEDGRDDVASYRETTGNWTVSRSTGTGFAASSWAVAPTMDHLSHTWAQDVNSDGRTDILAFDAYNGFLIRVQSSGSAFAVTSLVDTPWRTTLDSATTSASGSSGWVYFGQEFQWIQLSGLAGSSASAVMEYQLPRS